MALASLANLPRGTFQISTLSAPPDAMADRIVALLPQRLELHRLELDHTGLTDAGSGPLTRLARLEELSVVNTLLSDAVLENLAGIPGLKRLRVGWAQCSAPALAQFAKRVPGCQVQQLSAEQTTARTFLALGGGIRILNKDGTNRRIERLADLPAGAEIRLHAVALPQGRATAHRHLHCLRNLADLRSFGSWYNGINDDGVLPWRDLPRLEEVELGTNRLTARGLAHLSGFTTIRTLNLNLSTCDDAGLVHVAKLGRLESLSLRQTAVTDVSVEPLSKLSQLKDLDLRGTKITPEGAKRLRQALPGCQLRHP